MNKVAVIGLGYIGLPTALSLAANGIPTIGVDINRKVVETLRTGNVTFQEKGLEELFRRAAEKGIRFETEYPVADMYICAVPTPYDKISKVDPTFVIKAVESTLDVARREYRSHKSDIAGTVDRFIRPIFKSRV